MPILLDITYQDSSTEHLRIPAEIWRKNTKAVSKLLIREKEIKSITLDPHWETADVDTSNNYWPERIHKSRFELYKKKKKDMMRDYNVELKTDEGEEKEKQAN